MIIIALIAIIVITAGCLSFTAYYIFKNGVQDIFIMIIMNILCNFIAVYILSRIKNELSKIKIREDNVCKSYLDNIHKGIENFEYIKTIMPKDTDWKNLNYEKEIKFYQDSSLNYFVFCYTLNDDDTEVLLDNIKNTFFLDLNFKLMSVINKINVYKYSIKKKYDNWERVRKKFAIMEDEFSEMSEREQYQLLYDYHSILTDTRHLINGWKDLFKYLGYKYEENEYTKEVQKNRFYMEKMEYEYLTSLYEKGRTDVGKEIFNIPENNIEGIMLSKFYSRKFITLKGENNTQYAEITGLGKEALTNYKEKQNKNKDNKKFGRS